MAQKVFVSYKYADDNVAQLPHANWWEPTTVRDYVNVFMWKATSDGCVVYKGERDNEDLSYLSEDTIWNKLRDKIYDSSVTVVFISPNMRVSYQRERDQWIPWEIAFSLRESTRSDRTSHSNALLFVILPDRSGSYTYFRYMTHFSIVSSNIVNGYATVVQWNTFIENIEWALNSAIRSKMNTPSHAVVKTV